VALDNYLELHGVMQWCDLPCNQKVTNMTTTTMLLNRPPKKPPPRAPDPNRSGPPKLKGKGKAKAAMPEKETQANQPEASGDYDTLPDKELLKRESKKV
jgi:hypothetical protein